MFFALGILAARKIENRRSKSKHIDEVGGRAGVESFDLVPFSARSEWGSARPALSVARKAALRRPSGVEVFVREN